MNQTLDHFNEFNLSTFVFIGLDKVVLPRPNKKHRPRIFSKKSSNLAIIQLETDCTFFASRIIFINKEKEEVREAKDILILI